MHSACEEAWDDTSDEILHHASDAILHHAGDAILHNASDEILHDTSDEILKQIHGWQEYALEEGIHFDDPEKPYFVGHTQHGFRDAFAEIWDQFVRTELADRWPLP